MIERLLANALMKQALMKMLSSSVQTALWTLRRVDYHFGKTVVSLDTTAEVADPYTSINRVREQGHILRSYMYNGWIVTGYEEVTQLMRDSRISNDFRNNSFLTRIVKFAAGGVPLLNIDHPTMLGVDAPDHTRLRKLAAHGFVFKYVQSLAPTIERLVDELLDDISPDCCNFDVMATLAKPLPAIVIAEMMGVPVDDRHLFERWSEALLGGTELVNPALIRESAVANVEMREYLAQLTESKRQNPGQDLISHLIAAEEDGDKLTLDELYSNCILLLAAGHETTTRLIGNCLYQLLQHSEQMALARGSEASLVNALEESLRYEPPVMYTARTVKEPIAMNGEQLRPGQLLLLSFAGANRDPSANANPDVFDIKREKVTHVSFGYGIHLCLGMSLARLEAKIVFNRLFERFSSMEFAESAPNWGTNPMFRGLETLTVRAEIRRSEPAVPVPDGAFQHSTVTEILQH
ncbi:MAG: cytochrome P450 [Pseudomonadales bacterium]